jgi:phage-related protein
LANDSVIIRFGLDDRVFQSAISRIDRGLRLVQSEFSSASSSLSNFGNSTERLRLRADSLNRQIRLQNERVETLTRRYRESRRATGEESESTEELRISLNNATSELNNMQRELRETTRDLNTTSSRWNTVSQNMAKAGEKMKAVGSKMSSIGSSLTTKVTAPVLALGTAATKMAMDAVESENLFEVAMGNMADEARTWSEDISDSLGLNAYSVRENVATYNSMLTSMGLATDESLNMSEGLTQLSYDMASFYNLNPDEAFNKLRAGISGESEPLKTLGVLVNETTTKTYAYTHGIAKQGETLTEAQKVQARYGVIMEATKNAQGDLGRTLDSPTNKLRVMKEQVTQIGIEFGQLLIPILEKLINIIKPLLDRFQGMSKEQKNLIIKIGLVAAAVGPVLLILGKAIGIIGSLFTVISSISGAIASAGGASAAFGSVITLLTGPVGIIIASITALVGVFIALYKYNEDFRKNTNTIWNQVKTIIVSIINSIKELIAAFIEIAKKYWNMYGDDIVNILLKAFSFVAAIVNNYLNIIKNTINIVTSLIKGDWKGVWEGIKSLVRDYLKGVLNIVKSLLELLISILSTEFKIMKDVVIKVWNSIKTLTKAAWNAIKNTISSVSKSVSSVIKNVWNGILNVTKSVWKKIKDAIMNPIKSAVKLIREQINKIKKLFAAMKIKIPKIKLPHFKIKGSFSLSPPSTPSLSVNWYAKGGIFNKPSIIGVGENGTEAVLPIDKLDDLIAKAIEKIKVKDNDTGLTLKIENFINNSDKDIEKLAYELEFYRRRVAAGRGGI